MIYDLIIIGAGAAGLFAAANTPVQWKTLILEKTDAPGKKLLLTGSGQCNITNNAPIKTFLDRYGRNGSRLRPVLFPFSNIALVEFFKQNGLPLEDRGDGKVFPVSRKSNDVVELLVRLGCKRGVEFKYLTEVTDVIHSDSSEDYSYSVHTADMVFSSKRILIATGGESYPQTGSDGSFFACLDRLGLKLIPGKPALTPIYVTNYSYESLSGITFPGCVLSLACDDGSDPVKVEGSLLFTHKGLSGPCVLEMSRYVRKGDRLTINYLPDKNSETLRLELIQASSGSTKQIITILEHITGLARSFLELVCENCETQKNEKASRLTGRELGILAEKLTADSHEINGTGEFDVAMVTAGGVCLDEVDLKTMEAKRYPGLYFAGEVLDVDGDTGGYNLQFAFSSAKSAVKLQETENK